MLEIGLNDVHKSYGYDPVLRGVHLEVMSGERVAIVGRNGSGKSSILKIISGEEGIDKGSVSLRRGATIGYLEQIPQLLETDTLVSQVLMEPFAEVLAVEERLRALENQMSETSDSKALEKLMDRYARQQAAFEAMDGYAIEERFGKIVTGFGLRELLARPFNVLSGGQKTIVMLARTILLEPDILLLDEPTNHLDVRALEWFESYLSKYRGTVLIVSHDRYFLDKVANKTVILRSGTCTVFHGNYSYSLEEQERQLLIEFEHYQTQQKKINAMKAAIKRYRDWADRANNEDLYRKAKELEKRLERLEVLDKPQLEKARLPIQFSGERSSRDVLSLQELRLAIGELVLLERSSVQIQFQERVCLMGDNGSGKTTLIRAVLAKEPPPGIKLAASAAIGYIPQEIRFSNDRMTLLDAFRDECPCTEGQARGILAKFFFFGDNVYKRVSALSGGEKVLLKLAILMQREINLLILDEPTNHIDIETREMLEEALLEFQGTLLFISHDRYFIQKIAERILDIKERDIISYAGKYEEYRAYQRLMAQQTAQEKARKK